MPNATTFKSPRYRSNHRLYRVYHLHRRSWPTWGAADYDNPYGSARALGLALIYTLVILVISAIAVLYFATSLW